MFHVDIHICLSNLDICMAHGATHSAHLEQIVALYDICKMVMTGANMTMTAACHTSQEREYQ